MQNLILNRYRPLNVAGSGGFATVVAAWDTLIQRRVAIKCLRLDGGGTASDPTALRDIPGLEEARTAAMLSDSSIVGVYDFQMQGPMAYLIMEYVDGITLTQLMRQEGALSLDVVTCVFAAVSHALDVAHDNQVLHLDIKPDNVIINRQGQVKVADFGLAQLSHGAGFGQAAGGTIGYMPLEQMRLEAPDARTDEWALAALTYEMLMGENPFHAPDLAAAERAIEDAEVIIPSLVRVDVDEEVDEAVFGALAIDREDRFESVALFADAMLPHLGDARRGMRELAEIVGEACFDGTEDEGCDEGFEDEEVAGDAAAPHVPGRTHRGTHRRVGGSVGLGRRAKAVLHRVWACAACGFIGYEAAVNIPALFTIAGRETPWFWALMGAVVLAAAVWPAAGAAMAVAALAVALVWQGAVVPGVVVAVAGVAWWAFVGRRGHARANVGVSGVVLGAFGFASAVPLLAGYMLGVRNAVISAAFAAALAFALACAGSASLGGWNVFAYSVFPEGMNDAALVLLANPVMWATAAAWTVAAAVAGWTCSRRSRAWAVAGMLVSTVLLAVGPAAASFFASGSAAWTPDIPQLAFTLVAGVAMTALAATFDAPARSGMGRGRADAARAAGRRGYDDGSGRGYAPERQGGFDSVAFDEDGAPSNGGRFPGGGR